MSAPRTLEEKQDERGRLLQSYRREKRKEWRELCTVEPRLPLFRRALRRLHDPREIAVRLSDSWLRVAPEPVRRAALREIDKHAARMRRAHGLAPLDDPIPPDRNLFFAAREMLAVR